MKADMIAIGQNIKKARLSLGLNQKELASAIGHSSAAYISLIEKGERNITAYDLWRIAKLTGTPVQNLFP